MATTIKHNFSQNIETVNEHLKQKIILGREPGLEFSLTPKCLQYMYSNVYCYPNCPKEIGAHTLKEYFENLKEGSAFAYNNDSPKLIIIESKWIRNFTSILVMCERESITSEREGFKPYSIAEISYWNGFFIHSNMGSYFEKDNADHEFTIKQ